MKKLFAYLLLVILCAITFITVVAQVEQGTLGGKVVEKYEGCAGKRIGLVGASNTVDMDTSGKPLAGAWSNANIIKEFCPGATVFLQAKGGTWPGVQVSLVQAVLQNDNLDYVILDPSANGQQTSSSVTPEEYKKAAINLAQLVKDKNKNIKVIMLTNTPTKGAAGGYGTPEAIQRIKTFNVDLLNNKLGRSDLIDYAVDTYSATESSPGSDTCGYCAGANGGLGDGIHFGPAGRRVVMKTVMDTVFGKSTAVPTFNGPIVGQSSPTVSGAISPASVYSGGENCLSKQRCDEIDSVWLKIVIWINSARKGYVYDAIRGWIPYQEKLPTAVITPGITPIPGAAANFCVAAYGTNEQKALLDTIAWAEGTKEKYNVMYGGTHFNSYASHPVETGEMSAGGITAGKYTSTAAGRYQFLFDTFKSLRQQGYFKSSFGFEEQDRAALDGLVIAKRHLSESELKSAVDAGNYELVWDKLAPEWASLPSSAKGGKSYYGQPVRSSSDLKNVYQSCLQYHKTGVYAGTVSSVVSSVSNAVLSVTSIFGGGCPQDMTTINNKYCIDKWEATVVDKNTKAEASPHYIPVRTGPITADGQYNQFVNKETTPPGYPMPERGAEANSNFVAMAVSVPGKTPASFVTRTTAEQACQNAGKRLCTRQEWYQACVGPDGPSVVGQQAYPYGTTYQAGKCNVAIASRWPPSVIGRTSSGNDMMDPRIGTVKGTNGQLMKQPTGSFSECTNEYGVFDMVGNVHEIVADTAPGSQCSGGQCAVFVGSHYARPGAGQTLENQACQEATTAHDQVGYTDYSIGFRCCATLS